MLQIEPIPGIPYHPSRDCPFLQIRHLTLKSEEDGLTTVESRWNQEFAFGDQKKSFNNNKYIKI